MAQVTFLGQRVPDRMSEKMLVFNHAPPPPDQQTHTHARANKKIAMSLLKKKNSRKDFLVSSMLEVYCRGRNFQLLRL